MADEYMTPAAAQAQGEEAAQKALDDQRKNAAYAVLANTYGPVAGDPDSAAKLQQNAFNAQIDPLKVQAAQRENTAGTAAVNAFGPMAGDADAYAKNVSTQGDVQDRNRMAVFRGLTALKSSVDPATGSVDPKAYDQIIGQLGPTLGIAPEQSAQLKSLVTAPGGAKHIDDTLQSLLGPTKVTGQPVSVQLPDGSYGLAEHDQYGNIIQPNMHGAQPTAAVQGDKRLDIARQRVQAAAANSGVQLTPAGLELATQTFIKTNQMPAFGNGGAKAKTQIINHAAEEGASGAQIADSGQTFKSKQSYLNDLSKSSPTSAGGLARSAGAVFQHINTLEQMIDSLQNGNVRGLNMFAQEYKKQTGKAPPMTFDAQKTLVGDELTRYLISRGGTSKDREEMQAGLAKVNSPTQLRQTIKTWRDDIGAQLYSSYAQAKGVGAEKEFLGVLTPEARFILTGVNEPSLAGTVAGRPTGNKAGGANSDAALLAKYGVH